MDSRSRTGTSRPLPNPVPTGRRADQIAPSIRYTGTSDLRTSRVARFDTEELGEPARGHHGVERVTTLDRGGPGRPHTRAQRLDKPAPARRARDDGSGDPGREPGDRAASRVSTTVLAEAGSNGQTTQPRVAQRRQQWHAPERPVTDGAGPGELEDRLRRHGERPGHRTLRPAEQLDAGRPPSPGMAEERRRAVAEPVLAGSPASAQDPGPSTQPCSHANHSGKPNEKSRPSTTRSTGSGTVHPAPERSHDEVLDGLLAGTSGGELDQLAALDDRDPDVARAARRTSRAPDQSTATNRAQLGPGRDPRGHAAARSRSGPGLQSVEIHRREHLGRLRDPPDRRLDREHPPDPEHREVRAATTGRRCTTSPPRRGQTYALTVTRCTARASTGSPASRSRCTSNDASTSSSYAPSRKDVTTSEPSFAATDSEIARPPSETVRFVRPASAVTQRGAATARGRLLEAFPDVVDGVDVERVGDRPGDHPVEQRLELRRHRLGEGLRAL